MKIEEAVVDGLVIDDWGNVLQIMSVLKTRIKVKIVKRNPEGSYWYNDIGDDEIFTYDKPHLQFLKLYKNENG